MHFDARPSAGLDRQRPRCLTLVLGDQEEKNGRALPVALPLSLQFVERSAVPSSQHHGERMHSRGIRSRRCPLSLMEVVNPPGVRIRRPRCIRRYRFRDSGITEDAKSPPTFGIMRFRRFGSAVLRRTSARNRPSRGVCSPRRSP